MTRTTDNALVVISLRDGLVDEVYSEEGGGDAMILDWDSVSRHPRTLSINHDGRLQDFDFDTRHIRPLLTASDPVLKAMLEIDAYEDRVLDWLNDNETSTVLAALRHFQKLVVADPEAASETYSDFFEDHPMLSVEEIDHLCEKLNLGSEEADYDEDIDDGTGYDTDDKLDPV